MIRTKIAISRIDNANGRTGNKNGKRAVSKTGKKAVNKTGSKTGNKSVNRAVSKTGNKSDQQARQQDRQQDRQQARQQDRQDRFRDRTRDESSRFPGPSRDQFGRQRSTRDSQFGRDSQRSGQFGQQRGQFGQQYDVYTERQSGQFGSGGQDEDAGLGVNIVSEGSQEGVTVVRVFPDTPAEQMGIQEGDRITQVNGQEVQSTQEFISQIREMNPGDQVQLEVDRNQEEIIVSGQLESRDEALAGNQQGGSQSWRQENETWQTGYDEQRDSSQQQGRIARGGASDSRIQQIEQRIDRLRRELDQLRSNLQELRQDQGGRISRSGERQAGYDEDQGGYQEQRFGTRQSGEQDQWDGQSDQRSGRIQGRIIDERGTRSGRIIERGGQFDSQGSIQSDGFRSGSSDWNEGGYRSNEGGSDSPGGVTGGLRTRPDNDPNWERQ